MTLTKTHYEALAQICAAAVIDERIGMLKAEDLIFAISKFCARNNPKFDPKRFREEIQRLSKP
jgi:hypothetical protein